MNSPEGGNRVASPSSSSSPSSRPGGNGGMEYEVEQTNGGGLDRLLVSNRRPSCAATTYIPYSCIPCMRSVYILYSLLYSTGTRARVFLRRRLYVNAHTAIIGADRDVRFR
jgi:hypothetical protein